VVIAFFREVVVLDFEFVVAPGERPRPLCLVAHELRFGRRFRLWRDQFGASPPYATGPDVLFVVYYASAELGCYRVLGWPMPERILDLFAEFRDRTNGLPTPTGSGLLGALAYFGLDAIGAAEKKEMQEAIGSGTWEGRFSPPEILDYCQGDVDALIRLLTAMLPQIDLPRALLRGRYMAAAAAMEHNGTPIDVETWARLREGWTGIQDDLIRSIDLWDLRGSDLQVRTVGDAHGRAGHPVALARERPAGFERRHFSPNGEIPRRRIALSRATQQPGGPATERSCRGAGQTKSHNIVSV
jgi:hypothetical protein